MATEADALWVDCPTCHATAGATCTGGTVHSGRVHTAAREMM
jgi:hypothetical protein